MKCLAVSIEYQPDTHRQADGWTEGQTSYDSSVCGMYRSVKTWLTC